MKIEFSEITRYYLYNNASEALNKLSDSIAADDDLLKIVLRNIKDIKLLKEIYSLSAIIFKDIEEIFRNEKNSNFRLLIDTYKNNLRSLREYESEAVDLNLLKELDDKFSDYIEQGIILEENHKINNSKTFIRELIRLISEFQKKYINRNYNSPDEEKYTCNEIKGRKLQTFLSYAFDDRGLSFALFLYFYKNKSFLFIDWMWNKKNSSGTITKNILEAALDDSQQFLFLRTPNSELKIKGGNRSIKQWCAWEIGVYYKLHQDGKYFVNFYDNETPSNEILHDFMPMCKVLNGQIVGFDRRDIYYGKRNI